MRDLGEQKLPESSAVLESPPQDNSTVTTEAVPKEDGQAQSTNTTASQPSSEAQRTTTTEVRKPLEVPSTVSVTIDAKSLVDYVGPPIYQRERIYTKTSPPGVSSGLGYLGNGAGSVRCTTLTDYASCL